MGSLYSRFYSKNIIFLWNVGEHNYICISFFIYFCAGKTMAGFISLSAINSSQSRTKEMYVRIPAVEIKLYSF